MPPQHRDDREQGTQSVAEQPPVGRLLLLLRQRLEDALLGLRAETCQRPQLLLLRCPLELVDRGHTQLLPDPSRGLRAEPRQPHEGDDLRRDDLLALRQRVHLAVLDDLDDLLLDRLADSGQLLGAPVQRELGNGAGRLADASRRLSVREHAEGGLPFQLEQVGQQLQLIRDVDVAGQGTGHAVEYT